MKHFYFILSFFIFIQTASAQMPVPMHDGKAVKTGLLKGRVFQKTGDQETILPGQQMALVVYFQGERVLMLDKKSDDKGLFEFKNIFSHPDYQYAIGTMINEQVYVMKDLTLKAGQDNINVDFPVGEGSPYLMAMPGIPSAMPASADESEKTGNSLKDLPQKVALTLSVLTLLLAFYYAGKKAAG